MVGLKNKEKIQILRILTYWGEVPCLRGNKITCSTYWGTGYIACWGGWFMAGVIIFWKRIGVELRLSLIRLGLLCEWRRLCTLPRQFRRGWHSYSQARLGYKEALNPLWLTLTAKAEPRRRRSSARGILCQHTSQLFHITTFIHQYSCCYNGIIVSKGTTC